MPYRPRHTTWLTTTRRRSQAAKAADCKSAIPGSNPGGASCPRQALGRFEPGRKPGMVSLGFASQLESSPGHRQLDPSLMDDDAHARRSLLILAGSMLVAAVFAYPFDVTVARFFQSDALPGDVRRILTWSEAFAHGLGVFLIGMGAMILDASHRRYWPRILLTAYAAGLAATASKLLVARTRPFHFLQTSQESTIVGWLPMNTLDNWDHTLQSFPSGHTATAVGFACGLVAVYPRARWLVIALASLAALQRLETQAHYPADVLVGAAIGCVSGALFWRRPRRGSDGGALPIGKSEIWEGDAPAEP